MQARAVRAERGCVRCETCRFRRGARCLLGDSQAFVCNCWCHGSRSRGRLCASFSCRAPGDIIEGQGRMRFRLCLRFPLVPICGEGAHAGGGSGLYLAIVTAHGLGCRRPKAMSMRTTLGSGGGRNCTPQLPDNRVEGCKSDGGGTWKEMSLGSAGGLRSRTKRSAGGRRWTGPRLSTRIRVQRERGG